MRRLAEYLGRQSRAVVIRIGLLLVLVIGFANYLTGTELSFFIFYLVPVMVATFYAGVPAGLLMSAASALVWFVADMFEGRAYSHPFIVYWNAVIRLVFLSIVVVLQNALVRERDIARTDFLTGLANRKHFFETAEQEIRRALRYELPFSAAYIDLDNFKEINDRYGHAAGDRLLVSVAQVIRRNVRDVDLTARLGGDEFAVLLPQADAESARSVLSKLHRLLGEAMNRERWPVTFSFGVATFLRPPESADEMLTKADDLMYEAKRWGKNNIRYAVYGQ